MQLLLFPVSVETQEWPSFELMLNNEHACVCVCVCKYMKGYGGRLKCQRDSICASVRGIQRHQSENTEEEEGRMNEVRKRVSCNKIKALTALRSGLKFSQDQRES